VNLPTSFAIAQKRAQKMRSAICGFCASAAHANVPLSAHVPSFKRAGGNVTCYPSPLKRPVGFDGGPSFFGSGAGCPEKEREEVQLSCAEIKHWRSVFWLWRRFRAVWETPIWTAPRLVRVWVLSVPPSLAAIWRLVRASGPLRARFATTSACATDTQDMGRLTGRHHHFQAGPFRRMPGWSFFVFACAYPRGAR